MGVGHSLHSLRVFVSSKVVFCSAACFVIMTHILVKWLSEETWDVYPVRAIVNPAVGLRLLSERGAILELRNTVVDVKWMAAEEPSPAKLIDFGKYVLTVQPFFTH